MRLAALLLAGALAVLPAQQFRSNVNTVEVYATVVDSGGRLVPDLTAADFEIRDNGRLQTIDVFAQGTQPITIAVMVDESPSVDLARPRMESAVEEFSRRFLPGDRGTLGAFSHLVRIERGLHESMTPLIANVFGGRPRFPSGTALWDALDEARAAVRTEPGRRVVLMLTDANDNCSLTDPVDVVTRIVREGTMVYAIGVKGTTGLPATDLRTVTRDSGGFYFELKPDDDLAATFARVADELHRQYVIGFTPASLDGKVHELEVRAKRRGLTVRSRRFYIAEPRGGSVGIR